jgi:glycosyltransferase involved in cell wall biosynthesis
MMLRPKVLVFIDWFLPGYKAGGPIRSCVNMMNHLDDHNFYVVCGDRDYMDTKEYEGITFDKWNELSPNINVKYLSLEKQTKETYKDIIEEGQYDHIYINGIYSKRFSILPLQVARKHSYPITVSVRGMLKDSAIAVKKIKKTLFLRYARYTGLYKNVTFHVTNNLEKIDVEKRISKNVLTIVAPNLPKKVVFQGNVPPKKSVGSLRILSLARIAPEKNLLFALQTLSNIDPDIKVDFDIYGSKYDRN